MMTELQIINSKLRLERLKQARAKGRHSSKEWNDLIKEFEGRCVRCLRIPPRITKDHIVPIYQGGSDSIHNLQPLCHKCNTAKGPEDTNWVEIRRKEKKFSHEPKSSQ